MQACHAIRLSARGNNKINALYIWEDTAVISDIGGLVLIADILSAIYCGTENRNTTQREIKMEDVLELKDSSKKKFDGWHKNAKRNGSHEVNLMACTELLYRCCRTAVTGEGPKGRGMWRLNIVRDRTYTHTHMHTHKGAGGILRK